MINLINFTVAVLASVPWFIFVLVLYWPKKSLIKHVFKIFLLGMVICIPIGYFNSFWMLALQINLIGDGAGGVRGLSEASFVVAALIFILVAPIEEIVKYLIVKTESYRLKSFSNIHEGVMLAMVSALGFATYENYHYMNNVGFLVIVIRGVLCPPAHMLFSSFFGYYLGLVKTGYKKARLLLLEGVVIASLTHGIYNASTQIRLVDMPVGTESGSEILFKVFVNLLPSFSFVVILAVYFFFKLYRDSHTPILVRIYPDIVTQDGQKVQVSSSRRQRPSFPLIEDPEINGQIESILQQFESISPEVRIAAAKQAGTIRDKRILHALNKLEHDPEPKVRQAAGFAVANLKKILESAKA